MNDAVIVEGLSKQYQLGELLRDTMLRERIVRLLKAPWGKATRAESIWALKDVTLRIPRGQVVGIIGRNGAGKSTLLKVLSRITYPTAGSVKVNGRVASLLEVGTGFHEELTGRENVFLNGSILGMSKREVETKLDDIVDFAGVGPFIDTPIKRYSSGMRLRLGFAVAAHLDPDVLIVDEVLAVGDAGFQKKCLNAMEGLRGGGRTVLFVSHNMAAVENLCTRGIWIHDGQVRMDGDTKEVIQAYLASFTSDSSSGTQLSASRLGTGEVRFRSLDFLTKERAQQPAIRSGEPLVMRFHYRASERVANPSFGFRLFTELGTLITETGQVLHGLHVPHVGPGDGYIDVEIESLNLIPGRYSLSLWITGLGGNPVYDGDVRTTLDVESSDVTGSGRELNSRMGIVYFSQLWYPPVEVAGES